MYNIYIFPPVIYTKSVMIPTSFLRKYNQPIDN
jgi:hypothetical protein